MRPAGISALLLLIAAVSPAPAEPMTLDQFRQELLGMPLCGTPQTGPFAGKMLCTLHMPDGSAVVTGAGMIVRGSWEAEGNRICRRSASDPMDRRRCVDYERAGEGRYKNSDGVEFCIGPCP